MHENLNANRKVLAMFLNVKRAFDIVKHEILLKKLNHSGIYAIANSFIKSYLNNQIQEVKLINTYSLLLIVNRRVPQRTV